MNSRQFFDCVRAMRAYQREYFKHKRRSDLQSAKVLEAKVDAEIQRVEQQLTLPDAIQQHPALFDTPGN